MFPANDEYYSDFDTSETGRPTETHVRINNRYNFRRVVANNSRSTSSTTASRNGSRTSNHSSRYDAGRDHSSRYDAGRGTENGSGPISRSDSRGSSSQAAAVEPDAEDDVEKCVICFEALHAERVEELSCKHVFHHRCVQRYFNAIPATRNKTCVLCRHVIHQATQEEPDVEIIDPRPPHQPNRSLNGTTTNNEFQAISSASRQR
ncbi:MAG: RING finger protein, partial [Fimbriimonas sp.]